MYQPQFAQTMWGFFTVPQRGHTLLAGVARRMLIERLVRPRALERFFFGTAISLLYRVIELATQDV